MTVLATNFSPWPSKLSLQLYFDHLLQHDDVFRPEFLDNILLTDGPDTSNGQAVHEFASSYGSKLLLLDLQSNHMLQLAPGPYLIVEGSLWQVSRLYDDTHGAFIVGVQPPAAEEYQRPFIYLHVPSLLTIDRTDEMVYTPLKVSGTHPQTLSVAVPSRGAIHHLGLFGMRTAVKDMFDINGLTTTLCNRAFHEINSPSTSTAACVQKLVNAGVQILGTTKISSMISREEPTEAIDYHAPFNPRGDGYQSPAGSSSGSAVAIAAYEWLDFTIAEDTSGSGRRPAAANGCFQYRPTHDLVSLDGMWPTFLPFDTPVILSRDLANIAKIAPVWCDFPLSAPQPLHPKMPRKPLTIYYPEDYLPKDNQEHLQQLDSFVEDLKDATDGTVERFSISQKWQDSCPEGCEGQDLEDFLRDVVVQTFYYGFYHSQTSFRGRYFAKYQKEPYVNSFVKWRWNLGRQVTQKQHQEGLRRLEVYKSWFLTKIMGGPEKHSIVVMPISEGVPNYRDQPPKTSSVQTGYDPLFLSPILGCPDLVVPIAQMKYESRVSGRTEHLPICVNLLGVPGQDQHLIDEVTATLRCSGRPCAVRTGSNAF